MIMAVWKQGLYFFTDKIPKKKNTASMSRTEGIYSSFKASIAKNTESPAAYPRALEEINVSRGAFFNPNRLIARNLPMPYNDKTKKEN